jgi:hypothetical protein
VTVVNVGYVIDVRHLSALGAQVVGRVTSASESAVGLARNANVVLGEADAAFNSFLESARAFASANSELGLADDDIAEESTRRVIAEVDAINLHHERIRTIIWAT